MSNTIEENVQTEEKQMDELLEAFIQVAPHLNKLIHDDITVGVV